MKSFSVAMLLALGALLSQCELATAAEITPESLIGHYQMEARAFGQRILVKLRITSADRLESEQVEDDGTSSHPCAGTYSLASEAVIATDAGPSFDRVLVGTLICPDDAVPVAQVRVNLKSLTARDLYRGATVMMSSSLTGGWTLPVRMRRDLEAEGATQQ